MGVDYKTAPPLPAPTESESFTSPTETAPSDASGVVDEESHYSLPDDGTPVTIRTRGHRSARSQTSLLIEYFEGGRTSPGGSMVTERKPSVRVRLTPSKARGKNDHIQITETRSTTRKPSHSRRLTESNISRNEMDMTDPEDAHSMRSYASATEESNVSRNPIEVEIDPGSGHSRRRRKVSSPLIPAADSKSSNYLPTNMSDISAIPSDSFLDGSGPTTLRDEPQGTTADKVDRKHSEAREARKVSRTERKHRSSRSKTRITVEKDVENRPSSRRVSSRGNPKESTVSVPDAGVLSQLTASHRSYDSNASSKISINNPKLLETVEDAIRRLILPELDAIKRERSQRGSGRNKDRESLSSLTSVSREEISVVDKRKSSDTKKSNKLRDREARNELSPHSSIDQLSFTEDVRDGDKTPRHNRDLLPDEALGTAASEAALQLKARGADEKRQRRRRRTGTPRRELGEKYADGEDDEELEHRVVPPMPLSSEINPSELTRTSILSAESERPHSASEQMMPTGNIVHTVSSVESMDDNMSSGIRSPANTLHNLGAQHANVSRGDLRALPRKGPVQYTSQHEEEGYDATYPPQPPGAYDGEDYDDQGHLEEPGMYDDGPSCYGSQDVPAPLRYVPYRLEDRGLSPIQSVSGFTEGDSEVQPHRDSRPTQTGSDLSSPSKSIQYDGDLRPRSSVPSNLRSDDGNSVMSSALGYRNTVYTDNSDIGPVTSAQAVQVIEGNPKMVHQNAGPESAVASLVDPSMLSGSAGGGVEYLRESQLSYNGSVGPQERASSPARRSMRQEEERTPRSPSPSREYEGSTASQQFTEYELNEHGQKVPQSTTHRHSPTTSESAITAAALSRAAAAALKRQNQENESSDNEHEDGFVPEGVSRNRSFKERAKNEYRPDATPRHSVDRLYDQGQSTSSTGVPDYDNMEPEMGYGYNEDELSERRTPSATDERFAETERDYTNEWPAQTTPTHDTTMDFERAMTPKARKQSAPASDHDYDHEAAAGEEQQEDEWQHDRKRDTLLTNPYEGASPIDNLPGIGGDMLGVPGYGNNAYRNGFNTGSPGLGAGDEGYISAAPNDTREPMQMGGKDNRMSDPFYAPKDMRLSSMSQGMQSPLFDSSTGVGIDRIQSKDIIALMEHLMVRDAQRSARDTEILVTLVRSAAEMRNSFDDIKKLLAETEGNIVNDVNANTENSIKRHLGGPRPFPGSAARSIQGGSQAGTDDLRTKKRNILRRALQGLSAKGTNDLSRIEDMLIQLLTDVDVLKHQTAGPADSMSQRAQSVDNLQPSIIYEQDRGYEPDGGAGTSTTSHASHSGPLSGPQSRVTSMRAGSERKFSDHRISTVQEDDGEYEQSAGIPRNSAARDGLLSPLIDRPRGGSVPLATPPQTSHGQQPSASNENTPATTESKKHKSKGSSSFFPKISRWSETTASSIGKAFRGSGSSRKQEASEDFVVHRPVSRSGSDLANYDPYQNLDPYGDDKLHTGFSSANLLPQGTDGRASPRVNQPQPAQTSYATPEDPKYRAHRDSLNLQHPQPRQGQSQRFRTALESSAADYDSRMSPRSADWAGSISSLGRFTQQNSNRYSDATPTNVAPGGDDYNWATRTESPSSPAPARPPKEPLDNRSVGSQTPPPETSASKISQNPTSPLPYTSIESGYGTGTGTATGTHTATSYHSSSPRLENKNLSAALGIPARRPSGPRAMTPTGSESGDREERRRRRENLGLAARPPSALSQESETF
ncbi:hypothetical protein GGR50DRAFT_17485 [Xylaria sp. CBS 124048]|nr:hypothetical protein GGR50DRAFT_17485 [Xylaria sp. CBS 124048]